MRTYLVWDDQEERPDVPTTVEEVSPSFAAAAFAEGELAEVDESMPVAVQCPDGTLHVYQVKRETSFVTSPDAERTASLRAGGL